MKSWRVKFASENCGERVYVLRAESAMEAACAAFVAFEGAAPHASRTIYGVNVSQTTEHVL